MNTVVLLIVFGLFVNDIIVCFLHHKIVLMMRKMFFFIYFTRCVFCPIWIKFGIWANNGPRITWYKFEMATATFYASTETPHIPSRTIILFRFFSFVSGRGKRKC